MEAYLDDDLTHEYFNSRIGLTAKSVVPVPADKLCALAEKIGETRISAASGSVSIRSTTAKAKPQGMVGALAKTRTRHRIDELFHVHEGIW